MALAAVVLADNWVRNGLEIAITVAVGGMLWSAVTRLRRGEVEVVRCGACGTPTSRAYPLCRRCKAEQPDDLTGQGWARPVPRSTGRSGSAAHPDHDGT